MDQFASDLFRPRERQEETIADEYGAGRFTGPSPG
jgi:hypothetical protein